MPAGDYVPETGDVVWLEFDPQSGHEQAEHRPALVLSPSAYNRKTGLMICCPLSTRIKGYPFEVLADVGGRHGAVLADQVKPLDRQARRAGKKVTLPATVLKQVRSRIKSLPAIA